MCALRPEGRATQLDPEQFATLQDKLKRKSSQEVHSNKEGHRAPDIGMTVNDTVRDKTFCLGKTLLGRKFEHEFVQDVDAMRREFAALKEVNKMRGDSVEGIKEELIQLVSRPLPGAKAADTTCRAHVRVHVVRPSGNGFYFAASRDESASKMATASPTPQKDADRIFELFQLPETSTYSDVHTAYVTFLQEYVQERELAKKLKPLERRTHKFTKSGEQFKEGLEHYTVKHNTSCLTVHIPTESTASWKTVCEAYYGVTIQNVNSAVTDNSNIFERPNLSKSTNPKEDVWHIFPFIVYTCSPDVPAHQPQDCKCRKPRAHVLKAEGYLCDIMKTTRRTPDGGCKTAGRTVKLAVNPKGRVQCQLLMEICGKASQSKTRSCHGIICLGETSEGTFNHILVCGSEVPDGKEQLKAKADDVQREKGPRRPSPQMQGTGSEKQLKVVMSERMWPKSNEIKFKFKYTRGGGEEVRLPEVAGVPGVKEPGDHHEAERVQQQPEPEEAARGSKKAMDRISVLFACNMTGTDKLTPLVTGSSKNPRCFRGQRVPLPWYANKKAWVTGEIFREWMRKVDREMGKKICLLLDNYTAHPHDVNLQNIRLIFLPANTTSIRQPLDQGIIRNFKALYRSQLMQRILNDLDNGTSTAHSRKQANREVTAAPNQLPGIQAADQCSAKLTKEDLGMIQCQECQSWYHHKCMPVPESENWEKLPFQCCAKNKALVYESVPDITLLTNLSNEPNSKWKVHVKLDDVVSLRPIYRLTSGVVDFYGSVTPPGRICRAPERYADVVDLAATTWPSCHCEDTSSAGPLHDDDQPTVEPRGAQTDNGHPTPESRWYECTPQVSVGSHKGVCGEEEKLPPDMVWVHDNVNIMKRVGKCEKSHAVMFNWTSRLALPLKKNPEGLSPVPQESERHDTDNTQLLSIVTDARHAQRRNSHRSDRKPKIPDRWKQHFNDRSCILVRYSELSEGQVEALATIEDQQEATRSLLEEHGGPVNAPADFQTFTTELSKHSKTTQIKVMKASISFLKSRLRVVGEVLQDDEYDYLILRHSGQLYMSDEDSDIEDSRSSGSSHLNGGHPDCPTGLDQNRKDRRLPFSNKERKRKPTEFTNRQHPTGRAAE
ncbi:Pyruvate decarboxylase 2 [Branchiostoma belcheri]|nr:Pyruvate decarboxylase 2 [Branchiostoma belcheri]